MAVRMASRSRTARAREDRVWTGTGIVMVQPLQTLDAFAIAAALAAAFDVACRRIPNGLTVPLFVGGLGAQALAGGAALGSGLGAAALVAAVLFPAWLGRSVGGGDLKFAVAAAAWVGFGRLPAFLLASAIAADAVVAIRTVWP